MGYLLGKHSDSEGIRKALRPWSRALLWVLAVALLALPARAWAIPIHWLYTESLEYDTTLVATPAPNQAAPHPAGSLNLSGALSATSSLSSCSSSNLPVGTAQKAGPSGISDGAGGAIIAYENYRNDPRMPDIYAKHVLACGALDPTWPANGVLLSGGAGGSWPLQVVTDGSGGAFIFWLDVAFNDESHFIASENAHIIAQHLLSTGVVDPSWPANGAAVCADPAPESAASVTSDGAHGVFVTWDDNRFPAPSRRRVFVQHLLSTGLDPSWPALGVLATPTLVVDPNVGIYDQFFPEISSDGAGGAIVVWGDRRTAALTQRDIYAQRISSSGALLWSTKGVPVCAAPGQQLMYGFIAPTGLAGIAPTWTDAVSNAVIPDGANGCFVTWADGRTLGSTGDDIYAQHLTASGSVAAGWAPDGVPVCTEPGDQAASEILSDGAGGLIATWIDLARPSVFVQHVSASGVADGPAGGAAMSTAAGGINPLGVSDGSGGAVFAWEDERVLDPSGFGHIYAQHVRTAPTFSVDPGWPLNGAPLGTAPGGQDIGGGGLADPGGGIASNGAGGAIVFWTDFRDLSMFNNGFFEVPIGDVDAQEVLASGALPVFSTAGHVLASCPSPNTGLLGVTVDAYQVGSGDLVGSAVTDATGAFTIPNLCWGSSYTLTAVALLDYATHANDLPGNGCSAPIDFSLQCLPTAGTVQSTGFWKHQVGVATGGKGTAQVDVPTLCSYLDLIAVHFNSNVINQVIVYQPPASGLCSDKLQVARLLLDLQGNAATIARARQQLMSLLLNVAAGNIGQMQVISADGATVSQAITYCDNVIDSPTGDYQKASTIAEDVNDGIQVPAGMIPLSTLQIAYRGVPRGLTFRVTPNPGPGMRTFQFTLARGGAVRLGVYDVSGRLVAELVHGRATAGLHSISWGGAADGGGRVGNGIYFARLDTSEGTRMLKVLELRQ